MSVRSYNIIMILATLIAWLGFFIILISFNPETSNWVVFTLFYFVLFLCVLGTLSVLGLWFRMLWNRKRGIARLMVTESFRQALILSAVVVLAMWLQSGRLLTWWNTLLLILLAMVIEFVLVVFSTNPDKKMIAKE